MKILITGTSGFIGRNLALNFYKLHKDFFCTFKNEDYKNDIFFNKFKNKKILDIEKIDINFFKDINCKIDVVIHCAGLTNAGQKILNKKQQNFYNINYLQTERLSKLCAENGVKKFILLSTIGVYGKKNSNKSFTIFDETLPLDDYAKSKLEAEKALINTCESSEMNFVIIRPPAVYGPGVKGNFKFLLKLIYYSVPLPFKNFKNLRSYIGVHNLIDFINFCINNEKTNNKIFLISDNEDMELSYIAKKICFFMKKNIIIFNLPKKIMSFLLLIAFNKKIFDRLENSIQIDYNSDHLLNWKPKYNPEQEIKFMVEDFMSKKK